MKKRDFGYYVAGVLTFGALLGLAGCGESGNDAGVSEQVHGDAKIIPMPDGFSNAAFKCNGKVGVYTIYHGTSAYGAISTVPNDPNCP